MEKASTTTLGMDYLEALKNELWQQAIGTEKRVINRTNCERIIQQISTQVGQEIHWETIRNFFKGGTEPSHQTLDKISAFVLKNQNATYQHFIESFNQSHGTFKPKSGSSEEDYNSPQNNRHKLLIHILIVITVLVFLGFIFFSGDEKDYKQDFNEISLEQLKEEGWNLFDEDHKFFSLEDGVVKIGTLAGGYWVDTRYNETPEIKNLLFKKMNCIQCEIYLTVKDFHPDMPWQQGGLILMDAKGKSFDRERFIFLPMAVKI